MPWMNLFIKKVGSVTSIGFSRVGPWHWDAGSPDYRCHREQWINLSAACKRLHH